MRAIIRVGKTEGFTSSYNLIFDNGLRLTTMDLKWLPSDNKAKIRERFEQVVEGLRELGLTIDGKVEDD